MDTCILIDYSKNSANLILDKSKYCFSSIVQLEFLVGALNKIELQKINRIIAEFKIIDTDQDILDLSTALVNQYGLSHRMTIYDSIIAATCLIYEMQLWTYNKKDFRYIDGLKLTEG